MSNDDSNYSIAGRYRTVRKHLDTLGYKQAFSLDSLPLIELLLVDLSQTKESLKHFQSIAKDNLEACSQLQLAVDPYKCDNARLVQECNKVHLELIEVNEAHQKQINDYKKRNRKLESELSDLQLSFSKNLQRIKQLETESSNKSKKILELQGKCCKPIVNNVNLATKKRACYPLRRPMLEAESLPRTSTSTTSFSTKTVEPYVVDFVSMADHRISSLSNEVTKLKEELFLSNEYIESLKSQLSNKDKEMSRLRKMLEGGRPCTSINKDHCCLVSDKANGYPRNSEGDDPLTCLQQAKQSLEQQLKEALNKQHDAMAQAMKLAERNEELENELKDVDRIALRVEADCNSTVKENNRRVCRLQEKLEDVMTQVHVLESELTVQRREAQELRADLEACRLEKCNVQRALETTLEEKKRMTDRINNLTIMESSFNGDVDRLRSEIDVQKSRIRELEDRLRNENNVQKSKTREVEDQLRKENDLQKNKIRELEDRLRKKNDLQKSSIRELEQANQNVEKKSQPKPVVQRNVKASNIIKPKEKEEKTAANARNKFIRKPIPASKSSDKQTNHQEKRSESKTRSSPKECSCRKEVTDEESQCNTDRLLHEKNVIIESLQNTIDRIEHERDHYRCEYMSFKDQLKKDTEKDNEGMWSQICELRAQMSEKEHSISKLLREKKELCQEKFNLENKLHSYQMQQARSNSPCDFCRCRTSTVSERKSVSTTNKIERLERERDTARADVARLIEERDSLHERLKLATEAHKSEQRRLRESLAESESRLVRVERERRELYVAQETRRAAVDGLDEQLTDLKDELRRTKQELSEQRTQYFQLRALQDQTDQALGDVQGQLAQNENELSGALDRNKNLERQQLQLDNQIKELRQEIGTHRSRMAQMDREKDQLLMDLDEKTEKIAALEREIVFKEQQASNMEQQIRELTRTKEICIDQAADLDRQMRSMQLDMDNLQRQLSSASLDRENAIQENRRLQDDLAAVSCEVRSLLKELEASKAESQDLKRQLQTYVSEVRRAEELLSQKENERTDMLNHFRSLSLEATVLENNNHSLESEAAEARGALQSARDRICDFERQLSDKDCLIRGYESQITELTQNVASLEIQLQQATDQRLCAEDDLRTVRDLCMTLEQQKECISQRLDENTDLKTQYEMQLSRYRSEQEIFQDQMNKDHVQIDRLEKLLEEARRETINYQANSRELQNDVSKLKKKVLELQNKLSSETVEVRKYQNQAAEYNKQITELRRQVTNERFERAKMREESKQRYSKVLVPRTQPIPNDVDVGGNSCACSSSSGAEEATNSGRFKVRITEVSDNAQNYKNTRCRETQQQQLAQSDDLCCGQNLLRNAQIEGIDNYQQVNRVCFCTGKTRIGDLIANSKLNRSSECRRLGGVQNDLFRKNLNDKPSSSSGASSLDSNHCGRCGGRRKQKHKHISPCWIVETLNLMNKLLEEKRKARGGNSNNKCLEGKSSCNEVARIRIVNEDVAEAAATTTPPLEVPKIKITEDILRTKQQTIKYSVVETCNSNCTVSTQTLESIVTVSDSSRPHLLKILSEIQQYAKSIEDLFQAMNETMKQQQQRSTNNNSNNKHSENVEKQPQQPQPDATERRYLTVPALQPKEPLPSLEDRSEEARSQNSIANTSLPMELLSKHSDDISELGVVPISSTPRESETLLDPSADLTEPLDQPLGQDSEADSLEHLSLPKPQREALTRIPEQEDEELDSDMDSTEYMELARQLVFNSETNEGKDNRMLRTLEEEEDEDEAMLTIQEKIEKLRRDVYRDLEEGPYNREKNDEKRK